MTMKRSLSDSESEDLFDDNIKDGSPSSSYQVSDRKKRRGIIEKRRRDRINNSLSELRRLVPAAFEKQGSAKLEKAEILQMTVDHLKMLHQKGVNGYNFPDPTSLAMDYRGVGYRECAAEVARYLVTVEGMDIQDPLRLRLLSHLQCFSAQREAATKASLQNNNWGSLSQHHSQYGTAAMTSVSMLTQHQADPLMSSHSSTLSSVSCPEPTRLNHHIDQHHHAGVSTMRLPPTGNVPPQLPSVTSAGALPGLPQVHTQFPMSLGMNSVPMLSPSAGHYSSSTASALGTVPSAAKPYRPWGSELAF